MKLLEKGLPIGVTMPPPRYATTERRDRERVGDIRDGYEVRDTGLAPELDEMRILGDMFTGRQWTDDEKSYLEALGRVARTYNIMLPQLIAVEGVALNAQSRLRVYPRKNGEVQRAEIHTQVLNHSLDEGGYTHAKRRQLSDALIFRRGWIGHFWRYTGRYPDGQYVCQRLNPFDILFDYEGSNLDINQGRDLYYTRFFSADRIIQLYASANLELREYLDRKATEMEGEKPRERRKRSHASMFREASSGSFTQDKKGGKGEQSFNDSRYVSTNYFDSSRGLYRVIEYHEKRYTDMLFITDPLSGEQIPIPQDKKRDRAFIGERLMILGLDESNVVSKTLPEYWVTVVVPGLTDELVLMEKAYSVQDQQEDLGFAIKGLTVYDQHPDKGKHLGLMDLVKDPQEAMNRNRSSKEDLIRRTITPDFIVDPVSIQEHQNDWTGEKSRALGAIRRWNSQGGVQAPRYEYPAPNLAGLLDGDTDFLMSFAERATGINANIQGRQQSQNESGVLDQQRTEKSEMMLQPVYANVKRSQQEDGRYVHSTLIVHMREPRWIQVVSETGGVENVGLNLWNFRTSQWDMKISEDYAKYSVLIDTMAYSKTDRDRYFREGMAFAERIADPLLRAMVQTKILPEWDYAKREEIIGEIKKWLVQTQGPQILEPLEKFMAIQQMQNQVMMQDESGMTGGIPGPADPLGVEQPFLPNPGRPSVPNIPPGLFLKKEVA